MMAARAEAVSVLVCMIMMPARAKRESQNQIKGRLATLPCLSLEAECTVIKAAAAVSVLSVVWAAALEMEVAKVAASSAAAASATAV